MNRSWRITVILSAAVVLGACATAPKPLRGEFAAVSPSEAGSSGRVGERVRWGGEIVAVEVGAERTCFELLGKTLGDSARPRAADTSDGRFLACRGGFYDPALFATGRELTVIGTIEAVERRMIGEYPYPYPRIAADVVYLWPERYDSAHYTGLQIYGHPGWFMHNYWGPVYYRPYRRIPKAGEG